MKHERYRARHARGRRVRVARRHDLVALLRDPGKLLDDGLCAFDQGGSQLVVYAVGACICVRLLALPDGSALDDSLSVMAAVRRDSLIDRVSVVAMVLSSPCHGRPAVISSSLMELGVPICADNRLSRT